MLSVKVKLVTIKRHKAGRHTLQTTWAHLCSSSCLSCYQDLVLMEQACSSCCDCQHTGGDEHHPDDPGCLSALWILCSNPGFGSPMYRQDSLYGCC